MTYYFDKKEKPPIGPDDDEEYDGPDEEHHEAAWARAALRRGSNSGVRRVGDDGHPALLASS